MRAAAGKDSGWGERKAALRSISEVSSELDVPLHVLRFWESKFPELRPLKMAGGRRYYRREDVVLIQQIADLLYKQGYTIKGAQRAIGNPRHQPGTDPGIGAVMAELQSIATALRRL